MHTVTTDGLVQRVWYQADPGLVEVEYLAPDALSTTDSYIRHSNGSVWNVSTSRLLVTVEDR